MSLTRDQELELALLLRKMTLPTQTQELFEAWCYSQITNPVELAILRRRGKEMQIFLIYRKDKFYDGWHMPGSIILPGKTVFQTIENLKIREVPTIAPPFFFVGYAEIPRGEGERENVRGQALSLIYACYDSCGAVQDSENERFFPLYDLPSNILGSHKVLIGEEIIPWIQSTKHIA